MEEDEARTEGQRGTFTLAIKEELLEIPWQIFHCKVSRAIC